MILRRCSNTRKRWHAARGGGTQGNGQRVMIPRRSWSRRHRDGEPWNPQPGYKERPRPKPLIPSWPAFGHSTSWHSWRQTSREHDTPSNKSFKSSPGPQSRRPWKGCVAFVTDFSTRHGPEDPLHAKIRLPSGPHSETFLEQNHNTCRRVWSTLPPRGSTGRPAAGCGVHSYPVGRGAHSRTLETRVEHTPVGRRSAEAHVLLFTRSHRPHWETRPEEKHS